MGSVLGFVIMIVFVLLVAAFGMWLRGEGIDDSRLVAILAAAGEESDPAWADSRRLVREALGIAAAKR